MKEKFVPVCLYEPHKAKGIKHWLSDCRNCPDEEKAKLLEKYRKEKAQNHDREGNRSNKKGIRKVRITDNDVEPEAPHPYCRRLVTLN